MLVVDDAQVRYGDLVALDHVDLELPVGEVLAVLGPSGCGKSTLLRAVAGLEPLTAGRVCYDGVDLVRTPTHRRGFALMFQDGQLFEHRSVGGNVAYPLRLRRRPRPPRGQVAARVEELLDLVGLSGYAGRAPSTLSGGERQRVALARALAVEPRLLLLDEPLSALDRSLRERLAVDLRGILERSRTTALLVTHDHEEAFAVADRLAVMRAGRLVQTGPLEDVWRHPADAATARFLGYAGVLAGEQATRLARAAGLPVDTGSLLPGGGELALRRSALVLDADGPLAGVVVGAALAPEQVRLSIDVDGLGRLDAVARSGVRAPEVGSRVRLAVDASRLAVVGVPAGKASSRPDGGL